MTDPADKMYPFDSDSPSPRLGGEALAGDEVVGWAVANEKGGHRPPFDAQNDLPVSGLAATAGSAQADERQTDECDAGRLGDLASKVVAGSVITCMCNRSE